MADRDTQSRGGGPQGEPIEHGEAEAPTADEKEEEREGQSEHSKERKASSSSDDRREPKESVEGPSKSATEKPQEPDNDFPTPRRMRTAPAEGGRRPRIGPRTSTLLAGLGRRATGEQTLGNLRSRYSYNFDPLSSDSDSSSSSEEKTFTRRHGRKRRQQQQEQPGQSDAAEDGAAKRDAKKGRSYGRFAIRNDFFHSKGRVSKRDGRLKISINETADHGYIAKALGQSIRNHLDIPKRERRSSQQQQRTKYESKEDDEAEDEGEDERAKSIAESLHTTVTRPRLNIVIMVIGSRGDIQPFLRLGRILKDEYGHRVRVASHPTFRDFVEKDVGLEFYSVGGDPSELMAFMVKNPGLIPNVQTVVEGEVQRRRDAMAEMFEGFWRACINASSHERDRSSNDTLIHHSRPFIADAIIANPPSMAHVHIAEKLGVPLHMMFTFPYSPTTQFPHPLANIKPRKSNVDAKYVNFMSYPLVEMMTWQGLGDIVNRFRENTLKLEPVSSLWAPGALYRMKVPYTYLWSPSLVPKPKDWGPEIDIGGFVFLDLATDFKPPKELADFLDAGDPPVYIGFGSIVVDDPDAFTEMILAAVKSAGVRALVNKGWGGLGHSNADTPEDVFMLDNTPHDWLFPKCAAVVHHGGAGTTAIGLKCGKPTMIVPFFGDQPFWGHMVAEAKAGAHECIPYKRLTVERFAEGIRQCLTEEARANVREIADSIAAEGDGAENAVRSFHGSLPLAGRRSMRCSILQDRVAVWKLSKSSLRLSALAAELLCKRGKIKFRDLKLLRHYEWNDFDGPGDPVTGGVGALTGSLYDIGEGFGMVPVRIAKHMRQHEEQVRRRRERKRRREERERQKSAKAVGTTHEDEKVAAEGQDTDAQGTRDTEEDHQDRRPHPTREATSSTLDSIASARMASEPLPQELLEDVGWGLKKTGAALLTLPNNLHVATAQGFHNAPRLWGDATVRKPVKITGVKSGLTAARNEFGYGIYDGWTDLVRQPIGDWKDADTFPGKLAGLGTGFGKGVGGFVLKNVNAVWAPPAYAIKGLIKYAEKRSEGGGSKAFIRRAHITQGQEDLQALRDGDDKHRERLREIQDRVDHGWKVYEEIWKAADHELQSGHGGLGGDLLARHRLRKEKRAWDVNGALENVDTADRALRLRRAGGAHDLEAYFARRRREMNLAERPRASAMRQQASVDHHDPDAHALLPNGDLKDSNTPAAPKAEEETYRPTTNHVDKEEDDSMVPGPPAETKEEKQQQANARLTHKENVEGEGEEKEKRPIDDLNVAHLREVSLT